MNILFVLYGDFTTNSANPLVLYARELKRLGHACAIAVPSNLESASMHDTGSFHPCLYADVLADPRSLFPDGRCADVIHACTPRQGVFKFVQEYMRKRPTALAIFLEDNEGWIVRNHLGLSQQELNAKTSGELGKLVTDALARPFEYRHFVALADLVFVIQDKLREDVPPWVPCNTVMLGVDLDFFRPNPLGVESRAAFEVEDDAKVIVYHGGANQFTLPAIRTLCEAVLLVNRAGVKCTLIRTGPMALGFIDDLGPDAGRCIRDVGVVEKSRLPGILALADIYVQPGKIDPFEDLRLPGKIPEFLAMGKPLVMPEVGIAHLFREGIDAVFLKNGSAGEIAQRCIELFKDPRKMDELGRQARAMAESHFDIRKQAKLLEAGYGQALVDFDANSAETVWAEVVRHGVRSAALLKAERVALRRRGTPDCSLLAADAWLLSLLRADGGRIEALERRVQAATAGGTARAAKISSLKLRQKELQIADLVAYNRVLLNSRSWRVTYPLRALARVARDIKRLPASVATRVRAAGSFNEAFRILLRVVRTEGVSGMLSRLSATANDGSGLKNKENGAYRQWLGNNRVFDELQVLESQAVLDGAGRQPLISVLMPVFDPPLAYLEEAIASVRGQIYENWELCLADDASTNPAVRSTLQRVAAEDSRIKVVERDKNGNISEASNSALALASGDYIALLDHDDTLTADALLHVAAAIDGHPGAGIIYSDEDKIDEAGTRFDPHFKSDFNYELFLAQNMISHLGVYLRSLVISIDGFRTGFEGAQDYDLALRMMERMPASDIVHIPRVLYHWRAIAGSTARATSEKGYAVDAGRRAVSEHLARRGVAGEVVNAPEAPIFNRVIYSRDYKQPMVSILIPTRDHADLLAMCVDSIVKKTTYGNYEVVVIDNGSIKKSTFKLFESFDGKRVRVERNASPFNFSALNNWGVRLAKGDIICFMNNDIEIITPDWLEEMVSFALQPDIGAVGARLWYPNGRLQHGGIILGIGGVAGHSHKLLARGRVGYFGRAVLHQSLSAVTAACLVIRRSVFDSVGGFDEALAVAFNDVDFCLRVREKGFRNVWTPYAQMYHHESASRGRENRPEKKARFAKEVNYMQRRWGRKLTTDPAYNPNLTLADESFALARVRTWS